MTGKATKENEMIDTAAQEAIRIAEFYLPRASIKRQKALAMEIVEAINLCEAELAEKIAKDLTKLCADASGEPNL
jgi:hypothetical protein